LEKKLSLFEPLKVKVESLVREGSEKKGKHKQIANFSIVLMMRLLDSHDHITSSLFKMFEME